MLIYINKLFEINLQNNFFNSCIILVIKYKFNYFTKYLHHKYNFNYINLIILK